MAVNLSPVGGVAAQFFTNTGAVLTGGKLYTYLAGTTTPATTFTSSNGSIPWTNPIVLDAAGRVPNSGEIWLTDGILYKFVLKDSNDVLIATYDNVSGINSNFVGYTNQQQIITATAGQTVFDLTISYQPGTNSLSVFVDGVNQYGPGASYAYTETDENTVTFVSGLHVGAEVKFTTTQQQGASSVDASQVSYTPPFSGSAPTNVEAKLAQTISIDDFAGADFSVKLQAAIDSLPSTGGVIYAESVTGSQVISQQIAFNKPVTLYIGSATFTVDSGVTSPALKITRPCRIVGSVSSRFYDVTPTMRGFYGTNITVEAGYSGYVIGVEDVSPYDQFNAAMTQIENMSIDGNAKAASGVLITGTFNVRLAHLLLDDCSVGVDLVNLNNSQGFSEATNFEDLYIESCQYGIRGIKSAATDSLGHAKWEGVRINISDVNAIGMYFNGAYLYASNVTATTIWSTSGATNSVGIQFESVDIDERTVFNKVYFESSEATFVGWKLSGTSAYMPTIIATEVSGSGTLYDIGATAKYWPLGRVYSMNGDFEVGVNGWTYYNSPLTSSVAGGQTGKCLKIQTNTASAGSAVNNLPVKLNYRYRVVVWFKQGSGANSGLIRLGKSVGGTDYASVSPSDAAWTRYEFTFTATGTFLFINLYSSNGSAASVFSYYDSISVEELGYSLDL
jgi:hypothetical protein